MYDYLDDAARAALYELVEAEDVLEEEIEYLGKIAQTYKAETKQALTKAQLDDLLGDSSLTTKSVEEVVKELAESGKEVTQIIHNRFPDEIQDGKEFNFIIQDGKIYLDNGIQEVDFIIDMEGKLHLGRGHSYLANGGDVKAAGKLKVNSQGCVRTITNESGHYIPTVGQGKRFPELLNQIGISTKNAWLRLGDFGLTSSGYVDLTNYIYTKKLN